MSGYDIVVGDIFEDAWDAASDVADKVKDTVNDIVDTVPGAGWVRDQLSGPIKDFANSTIGKVVLRAIASSLTGGLAAFVGPQLAAVAFALPGLVRGEPFDEAWWKEFSWRCEKAAEMLGADAAKEYLAGAFGRVGQDLYQKAREMAPYPLPLETGAQMLMDRLGLDPAKLAAQYGIRQDVAAGILNYLLRQNRFPLDRYDIATGMPNNVLGRAKDATTNRTACQRYEDAKARGMPAGILEQLRKQCASEQIQSRAFKTTLGPQAVSVPSFSAFQQPALPPPPPPPPPVYAVDPRLAAAMERAEAPAEDNTNLKFAGALALAGVAYWLYTRKR